MEDDLHEVNELLNLGLLETYEGDEYKGYRPSEEGIGTSKFYLDRKECERLSAVFARLASHLK
jgi:hypothetical protein